MVTKKIPLTSIVDKSRRVATTTKQLGNPYSFEWLSWGTISSTLCVTNSIQPLVAHSQPQKFTICQPPETSFWTCVDLVGCLILPHISYTNLPAVAMTFTSTEQTDDFHNGCRSTVLTGWSNQCHKSVSNFTVLDPGSSAAKQPNIRLAIFHVLNHWYTILTGKISPLLKQC